MKVIAVIPARYHSSRFDGKPLAEIQGKPMIEWVYRQTIKSKLVDKTIIATDDDRILKAVAEFGGEAVMTSANNKTGTDRIAEAVKNIETDLVVNVQGDEPLINPEVIDSVTQPLLDDPKLQMASAACSIKDKKDLDNPNVVKVVMDHQGFALYFSRSRIPYQDNHETASSTYKHLGLYAYRKDFLISFTGLPQSHLEKTEKLEQLRAVENGFKIKIVRSKHDGIGVDTREDLEKVIRLMAETQSN